MKRIRSNSFNIHWQIINNDPFKKFCGILKWMKDFLESPLELLQHSFVCFFISVCKWVASVCLKNCDVQILLLAWHSYKVRINPQLIFSEKSWKSIEIHCLSWDYCDYRLLSTNITNQSTIILLTKIGALSTYRLASRWLILIDM